MIIHVTRGACPATSRVSPRVTTSRARLIRPS